MRRTAVALLLASLVSVAHAEGPDDEYVQIYSLIQQADAASQSGDQRQAAERYLEAQRSLEKLQKSYPQWNERVVKFRLNYVAEKLEPLAQYVPKNNGAQAAPVARKLTPAEMEAQVKKLGQQVQQLSEERDDLKGKLEEAFSAKAISPKELKKAEDHIAALEKERELLRTNLEEEKKRAQKIAAQVREETLQKNKKDSQRLAALESEHDALLAKFEAVSKQVATVDARRTQDLKALAEERDALQKKLDAVNQQSAKARGSELEAARVQQLEQKLDEANRQLAQTSGLRDDLQARDREIKRLQGIEIERDELKRRFAQLSDNPSEVKPIQLQGDLQQQLDAARKELASLQSVHLEDVRIREEQAKKIAELQANRSTLQKKIGGATAEVERSASGSVDVAKLKQIEDERDQLKKELDSTMKELADLEASKDSDSLRKSASDAVESKKIAAEAKKVQEQLAGQIESLRSKLQVYETKPEPFSAEELALFKKPEPQVVKVEKTENAAPAPVSANAAGAVADAERLFSEHRFEDAEAKYKQAVKQDEKNPSILANLAATQLANNKADEAEQTIKRALEIQPNDPYNLLVLGKIKFTQNKFDDALDALSRSARLNPNNAETQNYLGITLSEKGQRQPAEAALRAAIKLQPDNASAHHNLAIVYATQKPPFLELARWHYQKAVDLGHPKNADLEKMLAGGAK